MTSYYNEIDGAAAHVLEALIAEQIIAPGIVDRRSITDVQPSDLDGFTQCHFFAGGGLWSVAARMAGWPDDKPLWTGSCPCQPFSVAGKRAGVDDVRHLWPDFFRLIRARRPHVVVGEQVAGKAGRDWFHGVRSDLESGGYAGRAVDVPALAVDAPHIRNRLYWLGHLADAASAGRLSASHGGICGEAQSERPRHVELERLPEFHGGSLADADRGGRAGRQKDAQRGAIKRDAAERLAIDDLGNAERAGLEIQRRDGDSGDGRQNAAGSVASADGRNGTYWSDAEWITCHDGKARRAPRGSERGFCRVVDGVAGGPDSIGYANVQGSVDYSLLVPSAKGRVDLWRLAGNSIVPQLAAEVLRAYLETEGAR